MSDKIDYEKAAVYYSQKYKRAAEHNRQLVDDIEKADSDYFKMKKNRDGWRDAFSQAVVQFKKLSDICDKLITACDMLTEENDDLKNELKNMDYDFNDCRDGYENDIDTLERENEKLKNALESTEKDVRNYQNVCETLIEENGRLKKMIQTCGSY